MPRAKPTPANDDDRPLIIDELSERLEQFHVLAASDDAAADTLLNELGGSGAVEREMLRELGAARPLAHPERVSEAHRVAMKALEVLARNGSRPPSQLTAGPLTGVARMVVQQVIRYIVRNHQKNVVDAIHDLYARRLGWVPTGDASRLTLVRARLDLERASPAYKKSGSVVPTFLVGGAAASTLAQVARGAASATAGSRVGLAVAGVVMFLVLLGASWAILRGAAIARRRIQLTLHRPLAALWETLGWAGHPPRDNARMFALVSITLTALGLLVVPAVIVLVTVL